MSLFRTIGHLATAANVAKGIGTAFTAGIAFWVWVTAVLANIPTPVVILLAVTAALVAALVAHAIIALYERISVFFITRKEQDRITEQLNNLGEGIRDLDLRTAAGIWAGTLADDDVRRHSYFRGLKYAVRQGHLITTYIPTPKYGPNIRVDINSLKDYWKKRGVIR